MAAPDAYFANLQGLALAEALHTRVRKYYQRLPRMAAWRRYAKALAQYYGLPDADNPFDVTSLGVAGEQGELTTARVGHVGAIGRHILTLATQTKPAWQPVAINTDYASAAQTSFCSGVLDYFFREQRIHAAIDSATEWAIIFGLAYLYLGWEPKVGDVYAVDGQGYPVMRADGNLSARAFTPLQVVVDLDREDTNHDWFILRPKVNRWDLVARYCPPPGPDGLLANGKPETEDARKLRLAILGKPDDRLPETGGGSGLVTWRDQTQLRDTTYNDLVPVYRFFHGKTAACPDGRWCDFLDGSILLGSGPLQYEKLPVLPIASGYMVATPHGDSSLHHLGGLQDLVDQLVSAVATNNINGATNIIITPDDAEWNRNQLTGMTILSTKRDAQGQMVEPKALALTNTKPETYQLINMLAAVMGRLSGMNDVVFGDVPKGDPSGALMALVHQQAVRFQSGIARGRQQLIADSGNLTVSHLKRFASEEKQVVIAGKNKVFMVEGFTGDKLNNIARVQVESADPLTKEAGFLISAADNLLQRGLINSVEEYFEVVETGRREPMTENPLTEQLNIRKENELIREGKVPATPPFTDHPEHHILEHRAVLDDPLARENPNVVNAGLAHIQEHINVWRATDTTLLMLLKFPLPPPPPGLPGPGGPGAPGPKALPPGGPPPPGADPGGPPSPPGGPPKMPNLPKPPINPATGQPWNPVNGGAPPGPPIQ